jgi:hypothetical protein
VTLGFWTSAFTETHDAAVHAANRARLLALRERLVHLAKQHGGVIDAPMV